MFTNLAVNVFYFFLPTKSWGAFVAILILGHILKSLSFHTSYWPLSQDPWVLSNHLYFQIAWPIQRSGRKEAPVVVHSWDVVGPSAHTWNLKSLLKRL